MVEKAGKWELGERIGDDSGYGKVYRAKSSDGTTAVVKIVDNEPGAERELLLVKLDNVRHVIPVIETGDLDDDRYYLVMPEASTSLRQHIDTNGGRLDRAEALAILHDVAETLVDLDGQVVHRDIKPKNVLKLGDEWCLCDFGISRYADASTSTNTRRDVFSQSYAAPEQWRHEATSSATDVYAFGVTAYELLSGSLPFPGPSREDFSDQHRHAERPTLDGPSSRIASLVKSCMRQSPGSRPNPKTVLAQLDAEASPPESGGGSAALQRAHAGEVDRQVAAETAAETAAERTRSEEEKRNELAKDAAEIHAEIVAALVQRIKHDAPSVRVEPASGGGSILHLGDAVMELPRMYRTLTDWPGITPKFTVVAHTGLGVRQLRRPAGSYEGRSHALWYADAWTDGQFVWCETAFMYFPFLGRSSSIEPFDLPAGREESGAAVWRRAIGEEYQLAWPFTPVDPLDMDDFLRRWCDWFALAADRNLQHPSQMPERDGDGGVRR